MSNSTGYYSDGVYYHYVKGHLGNICAVVNSAADTLVQSTIYYPSGVPMVDSRCSISDIYNALNADVYSLEALEHFFVQEGIDNNIIHYAYDTYHGWEN